MTKQKFKFRITTVKEIELEIDPDKITPEIMQEYNDMITWIGNEPKDHIENIAVHAARENWWDGDKFLEGYGDLGKEFDARIVREEVEDEDVEKLDA